MKYFSEEQIALRELRNAAYHESGHKMVCERFGGTGDAVVWRNENRAPEEAAWRGQFRMRVCPEAMHIALTASGVDLPTLPPNWHVQLGMAGLLAEELLCDDTNDAEVVAYNIYQRISFGEASPSDLGLMGIRDIDDFDLSSEVVGEGMRHMREMWSAVSEEAERLIADALLEAGPAPAKAGHEVTLKL